MHRYHYLPDARPAEARVSAWKARERMPKEVRAPEVIVDMKSLPPELEGAVIFGQMTCPEAIFTRVVGVDEESMTESKHMDGCDCPDRSVPTQN